MKYCIVLILIGLWACNSSNSESSHDLSFLKQLDGKYPADVKLWENTAWNNRVKGLLGEEKYQLVRTFWAVESPMQFQDNVFIAEACEQHNCYATNFIIVMDFNTQNLTVGIRKEGNKTIIAENGQLSPKVNDWDQR